MKEEREQEISKKMIEIFEIVNNLKDDKNEEIEDINYYEDFSFKGSNLAETNIFIVKISNQSEGSVTYQIYSERDNELIASVNEKGKLQFAPEYIEKLKQIDERYVDMLKLEDVDFELPEELEENDRVFTREEREELVKNREEKEQKEEKKTEEEKKEEKQEEQKPEEEQERENIARKKHVPVNNILMVRENSNFYYDHPNLEPNLYFYRGQDGKVRAEYIDQNGEPQPSKYFEESTTSLRQETISIGNDGNPVTKEVPYQIMKTKGLNNTDKDIRDVRMAIKIDSYGYMDIEEARQGKNGEWLSHDVEVKGRRYNSHAVNETTSIKSRNADPDKQTEAYEKVEDTGMAQDGVQYGEMYLIEHADEIIEHLIDEGYQKDEAVAIFNYVVGEEKMTIKEAKEKVNEEINNSKDENLKENSKEENSEEIDEEEERTPWGDAEARRKR